MNQATFALAAAGGGRVYSFGAILMDAPSLDVLRDRFSDTDEKAKAIIALADSEDRDPTDEEKAEIDRLCDDRDRISADIQRRERVVASQQPAGRRTSPDGGSPAPQSNPVAGRTVPAAPRREDRRGGYNTLGDFALSVRNAARGQVDQRLVNAASTYGQEGVGADGGFAVPPDFRTEVMSKVFGEDSLVSRTDRMPITGNTLTMPIDMTTPWQTTGGIQSYWTGEAATKTQSKVALEDVTVKVSTLATLVPVTEELLEDAPAMDAYLRRKVPEKMDFKISYALAWGNGVGMPLGWMNAPCLVTQAAENAQATDTINVTNVLKMLSRMPVSSRSSAIWLIHPDAEPQLPLMVVGTQPVYMPPGGVADAPFGRLFGRPIIPHQICETVGDLGDIMFVDLAQYLAPMKTGGARDANGMRSDVSIHLWFDQDIVAYRFTIRMGGQPWWSTTTAMRDGASTQSPFVTLASR